MTPADDRRARLGLRHHLATPAADVHTVAADLAGIHSSDPVTVYLALWARVKDFQVEDLERALYDDRSLVRMLGMRRTMFVVTREGAAVMDAACTKGLVAGERRRQIKLIEDSGIATDGEAFTDRVAEATMEALVARGEATAAELKEDVPDLDVKIEFGEGRKWRGSVGLSTRVLFLLATEGKVLRGRPLGSWISSQYRWATTESWLGGPLPELDEEQAQAELAGNWRRTFGPGTELDLKWWTGWNVAPTRRAMAAENWDDADPVEPPGEWVALLPSLDPTVMGWKEREWYLGEYAAELFDRNGNAGPTVWWNGRIVGGWAQRPDGEVVFKLLEPVGKTAEKLVDEKAAELTDWLGDVVVTPRFRTPLEKRLIA